jgi:hypothetical protein
MNDKEKFKEWIKNLRSRMNFRFVEIYQESDGVCENLDLDGDLRFVDNLTDQSDVIYSDVMFMRASDLSIAEYEVFQIQTKSFGPLSVFVSPVAVSKVRTVVIIYYDELDQAPQSILHKLNESQVIDRGNHPQ